MKQHKGNIVLMVLFILISASAFALLMMQYTQSMFDHTRMTYDYNKAYYLANAGVELGLADSLEAEVNGEKLNYAIGYENTYTDSDGQFGCDDTSVCGLSGTIIARDSQPNLHTNSADTTTECTSDNAFMLSGGASLAFPLFVLDANKEVESGIGQNNSTITIIGANGSSAPSLDIGATIRNTDGSFVIATLPATTSFTIGQLNPQPSGKYGEYLVLINKNSSDVSFCVQSTKELARQRIRVDGQGHWNDYDISLSAAKKVTLPGFLFSTSVGR